MRTFVTATLATTFAASLLATPVFAGDLPLPAGKPAGLAKAQSEDNTILYVIGGAAVIAGIVILASNSGSNGNLTPGTTPSSTTTS
jgi:hypothetical protein